MDLVSSFHKFSL